VACKVNSSHPRTESLGTPQNMGTASEKNIICIDSDLFVKNDRIQVSDVSDMAYQSGRRSKRTDKSNLATSVSEASLNTQRVIYNWKISVTTGS